MENINACLTFLSNLGVNIEGLTAKGRYRRRISMTFLSNLGVNIEGLTAKGWYTLKMKVSMTRKCDNHKPQTNPQHHEEETQNNNL